MFKFTTMQHIKGRGAQVNPDNKFLKNSFHSDPDYLEFARQFDEDHNVPKTQIIRVHPKSIVNKVTSPDLPFDYSMNPYQGCEHGCVYCYARNTHEYWGYSAGLDFETKVLVKANAVELLERKLNSPKWQVSPIMMSGNTDCYQPVERKLKITRSLLKVFADCRHPVGIITKNALILRDIDLLTELARERLVHVVISITSLKNQLKNQLEPRTSSVEQKLKAISVLSKAKIPVSVMMAPIIPAINSQEIMEMAERVADHGAKSLNYTILRLNGVLPAIFEDWLTRHFPDRAEKVLSQVKELHGGQLNDSRFKKRMSGEGAYSSNISQMFEMARKKYKLNTKTTAYNLDLFRRPSDRQLSIF